MKSKKLFLIAGSTGGHALPIYDIYSELKSDYIIKIFVSGSSIENQIFNGSPTLRIVCGRFNRHNLLKRIMGIILLAVGFVQSFFYLLFCRPKLIMSKGGYLAVPILSAAKMLGIPYFTHESDSEMGLTNKKFGPGAKKLFVGFPIEIYHEKIAKNAIYTGQIIKKEFLEAEKSLKVGKSIFITGGSQGSKAINKQIFKILPELLTKYEVSHQIGDKDLLIADSVSAMLSSKQKSNYHYFDFSLDKIRQNLLCSDLIIGRAGANTIGEIAALNKASILIPYPYAAADHQSKNAKYLEKSGSAIVIKEDILNSKNLLERIDYLFSDPKNIQILGKKMSQAIKYDGLITVTDEIKKFMKG